MVEFFSGMQVWAMVVTGRDAASRVTASDVISMRGLLWRWIQGSRRSRDGWTLAQRSMGAQLSICEGESEV